MYERQIQYTDMARARVTAKTKARLVELAGSRGESAIVREAIEAWIKRQERKR